MRDQEFNYTPQGEYNVPSREEFHPPKAELTLAREEGSRPKKRGLDKSRKRALMQAAAALVTVTVVAQGLGAAPETGVAPPPEYREFLDDLLAACIGGNDDEILAQMREGFELWGKPGEDEAHFDPLCGYLFYDGKLLTNHPGATPALNYYCTYYEEGGTYDKYEWLSFFTDASKIDGGCDGIWVRDRGSNQWGSTEVVIHGLFRSLREELDGHYERTHNLELISGHVRETAYDDDYYSLTTWDGKFILDEDDIAVQATNHESGGWCTYLENGEITYADSRSGWENLPSPVTLAVKDGYLQLNHQVSWNRFDPDDYESSSGLDVPHYVLIVFPDGYGSHIPISPDRGSPEASLYHSSAQRILWFTVWKD